jgi:hypothetical protein
VRIEQYYDDPLVRARIGEYLGASGTGSPATAAYVASLNLQSPQPIMWENATRRPASDLAAAWVAESDIARSLLDRDSLVFMFELDYLNPDRPAEPFIHPDEVLRKLEPAYQASRTVVESFGLWPYTLVTGRGYHFTGRIPLGAAVVDALAAIAPGTPAWVDTEGRRSPPGLSNAVSPRAAKAWTGLGCLVEYLAHLVLGHEYGSKIPLVFNGTPVGTGVAGRECVSLDFSFAGDPLDVRYIRCAFSTYQWHRFRPDMFGAVTAATVAPLAAVPRGHRSLEAVLRAGRTLDAACLAARRGSAILPDLSAGVERLLGDYLVSPLAEFHRHYYGELRSAGAPGERSSSRLPPCGLAILAQPNDFLLKPGHIQHLVRLLLARGWSAAQAACLVRAAYEADHQWGNRWQVRMDAASRAEFDVRVFAGLVSTGADRLIDFNCVSAQEKDICPRTACQYDLRVDRERLTRLHQ